MNVLQMLFVALGFLHSAWGSGETHFSQSVYMATVNETALPDHPRPLHGFLTLTCFPTHPPPTYSINHTTSDLPFEVDSETGELNATADIDYDSMEDGFEGFYFNVSCSNVLSNSSAVALVYIHVAPVNEFIPDIDPCLVLNITEATPSGTLLLSSLPGGLRRLSVQDRDRGPHGQLNYSLLTPLNDHFSFDPLHANLTLVRAVDFESEASMFTFLYHEMPIKIRVCDAATPTEACPIIHFPLFIIATDDNEPVFLNASYTATVSEAIAIGSSLLRLECSDADVHIGGVRRIALSDPPPEVELTFSLGELSGNGSVDLVLARELDFDQLNKTYQFQVSCQDLLHISTASVSIHVLDVNDNAPVFSDPLHEMVVVPDSTPAGPITSVTCTDQDSGRNGEIVYEILPQHHLFAVDQVGSILVSFPLKLPDFTLAQSHNISIQCRDKGSPPLSSKITLTLTISKTDTQPPQINISNETVSLLENSSIGTPVLSLSVYDVDSEAVALTITNQSVPETFIISPSVPCNHPNYPQLVLNASLDRETTASHLLHLQAVSVSSRAEPQNISFSLTVSVEDVNDNAPECSTVRRVTLTAGYFPPTHLLTLNCSDPDLGLNQQLVYSLASPLSNGHFTINQTSGRLMFEGAIMEGDYLVTLTVSDMGTPAMSTDYDVQVHVVKDDSGFRLSLAFLVIILVVIMLVLVGVASGCGLCYCYWYRTHVNKKQNYFISSSEEMSGVTIISPAAFPDTGSVISHRLVPLVEEMDRVETASDEVTVTFNPATESQTSDFHGRCLSAFLDEQWPLSLSHQTSSVSSSKEDLVLQLELETYTSTFKDPSTSPSSGQSPVGTNERAL